MIWWHRLFCGLIRWSDFGITYTEARCEGCGKRWMR